MKTHTVIHSLVLLITVAATVCGQQLQLDEIMLEDPQYVKIQPELTFRGDLKERWIWALKRPEYELRRRAADAVSEAQSYHGAELSEAVGPLR